MKKLLILTFMGSIFSSFTFQSMGSEIIPWEAKSAHANCEGAIAGSAPWPSEPKMACKAMHMCANEAVLTKEQDASLDSAIRRLPDCGDP
jgi:hypothetical protein